MDSQVETENRLIEAAVTRAVEEKQQSEATVLGLQQEVSSVSYPLLCFDSEVSFS
jgi:hypothetical protein